MKDEKNPEENIPPAAPPKEAEKPSHRAPVARIAKKVIKGTREFEHHLFKLKPATMKKNVGWKFKEPKLLHLEHVHIFHSIDDTTFQENKQSTSVGGHYHEVTFDFSKPDSEGNPMAECGPPIRLDLKKLPGGRSIQRPGPVRYEAVNELGDEYWVVDDHIHEVQYIDTEVLTQQGRLAMRQHERAKISASMDGAVSSQPGAVQKLQAGAAAAKPYVQE